MRRPRAAGPGSGERGADRAEWERALAEALQRRASSRWLGWRRRALVAVAAAACVALFLFVRTLAGLPAIPADWRIGAHGNLTLVDSPDPALRSARGRVLVGVSSPGAVPLPVDALLLHPSGRWQVSDEARRERLARQAQLEALWASGPVSLHFSDGGPVTVRAAPRGLRGMGALFWVWSGLALMLTLLGAVLALARPDGRNLPFLVMCLAQAGNLAFAAAQPALRLGHGWHADLEGPLRAWLDAVIAAATLQLATMATPPAAGLRWLSGLGWVAVAAFGAAAFAGHWPPAWPGLWASAQILFAALMALAWLVASRACRILPDPFLMVMRRLLAALLAVWGLVTLTVAVAAQSPEYDTGSATLAAALWTLFGSSLLLLSPFLSRSRHLLREFALLAGVSTVATSLDLLFVALFALEPFTSLALAVFLALAVYAGVRQWLLNQMLSTRVLTTERTFEQIHRLAREVQAQPGSFAARATQLLRELFDPMETLALARAPDEVLVLAGGAALVVPLAGPEEVARRGLVLRFAGHGRRLFGRDDARLAERVVDQLRRAVAYDSAVERGRTEERQRIAQDLHDDIGARLVTLMYQAQTPEMEDYIRNTLKDLKTLSRGLAAGDMRFSHAAAEWKADLTQRAEAAGVQLRWSLEAAHDPLLPVVPWSAITRVLRELASNALAHGSATHLDVSIALEGARLALTVADDGRGRNPQAWAPGLGVGGVRKRVKQLGGEVRWYERQPRGIACEVVVPEFTARR